MNWERIQTGRTDGEFNDKNRGNGEKVRLGEYITDPDVVSASLAFLGGKRNTWRDADTVQSEYLGVGTIEKAFSGKRSPVSTVRPEAVEEKILAANGRVELFTSLMQKPSSEREGLPSRGVLHWDIDRFRMLPDNNYDEATPLNDIWQTFSQLEGAHETFRALLVQYGIASLDVMSGKGIHIYTQVTDPEVLQTIKGIAGPIEDTLRGKFDSAHLFTKSPYPIPYYHEEVFKGITRLQQYVIARAIGDIRRRSPLDVEIWDKNQPGKGRDGIALDNTSALFYCNNKLTGIPGSPYFIKPYRAGAANERIRLQLPIRGNGFDRPWQEALEDSYSFNRASRYLSRVDCQIPDASEGVRRLITDYMQSDLRRLHSAMDSSFGDQPEDFDRTYRADNYEAVLRGTQRTDDLRNMIWHANPMLVQLRNEVDTFIFEIFHKMGGSHDNLSPAPHVAGLLRAIYEDPRMNWGHRWMRFNDPLRYARGSVEMALGQMFEE